jgi:lipopolysaccharide heptosyltransferase I
MHYPDSPHSNPDPSARILIVRLSAHGDVIHTLPLLAAIKRKKPDAYVGWLIESSAESLLVGHPQLDRLHVSQRKRWLKLAQNPMNWPLVWREVRDFVREIRQAGYHISFDVQGLLKSALWPWMAQIPIRYGYKNTRESADWLYNRKLPPMAIRDAHKPAVQSYLDFARAIGCAVETPVFVLPPVTEASQAKVSALLAHSNRPLVVLAPFTRWPSKHWPMTAWASLLPELLKLDIQVAILGAPSDEAAVATILGSVQASSQVLNLVGKTDWPDLYALFARTRLLIGLDSAPLHIADAVGIPDLIGLYGPTAPGRTGPIGPKSTVLSTALACQPCYERNCPIKTHDCMRQLTPEIVLSMVQQSLGKGMALR